MKFSIVALLAFAPLLPSIGASPLPAPVEGPTTDSICIGTVFFCGRNTVKKRHVDERDVPALDIN
jgi:hypothetical protein